VQGVHLGSVGSTAERPTEKEGLDHNWGHRSDNGVRSWHRSEGGRKPEGVDVEFPAVVK
jgi:hypothetical protein